jgi:hypothetical protein
MVKNLTPIYAGSSTIQTSQVAKQLEQERLAEEQEIRRQYLAQMATIEQQARAKFEADLEAKRAAAWADFEAGLTAEKSRSTFESDLTTQEALSRKQFEAQLTQQRRQAVEIPLRTSKREYAMLYGVQMLPRHYRALKAAAEETYTTLAESEKEAMEEQVKTWKSEEVKKQQEAVESWESEQRKSFESDLAAWEKESRESLETQIAGWQSEQAAALEPQITQWKEAWQPKGLAERMVEFQIPSLALGQRLSQALGLKWVPSPTKPFLMTTPEKAIEEAHVHPLALPAGVVGSVESLVYSVGQLAGVKTPRIPATLSGGLITSGIESVMSGQLKASPEMQTIMEMPEGYAAGTVLGDILIAYGISKGVKMGAKAIKGAASFVYEESGLKYSHALYETKEALLGLQEALPKSPIAAIKESHAVYELSEALSSLKHKIMPTKYMKAISEGIIGLPTLEEQVGFEGIAEAKGVSKALQTAQAIGVTPLEYGKSVYPKVFAGMELLGWTEVPKTAGFGLTVPAKLTQTAAKVALEGTSLSEALAETMWIGATAQEKWAAKAGFLKEEWIEKPPKLDVGLKMIKGGREFTIPEADILGFTKLPKITPASAGEFFFQKQRGKLPTLKDLLKDIKAQTTTPQLLESPAKIAEAALPKLATVPEVAGKLTTSGMIGLGAALGLKPLGKQKAKKLLKPVSLSEEILKPEVASVTAAKAKVKQTPLLEEVALTTQALKSLSVGLPSMKPPSQITKTPRKKEEPYPKIRRVEIFGKKPKKKMAGYLYPVATVGEAAKYVFGKKVRSKKK